MQPQLWPTKVNKRNCKIGKEVDIKCRWCEQNETVNHLLTIPAHDQRHPKPFGQLVRRRHDTTSKIITEELKREKMNNTILMGEGETNLIPAEHIRDIKHNKPDLAFRTNKDKQETFIIDTTFSKDATVILEEEHYDTKQACSTRRGTRSHKPKVD